MAGARAKGPQIESLQRARVWFGQVSLGLYSPLRYERGLGEIFPVGMLKGFGVSAMHSGSRHESAQCCFRGKPLLGRIF